MTNKINFSAGPAMLPHEVLLQAQQEMLDWNGSGLSVMEMSHRGKEFTSIAVEAEQNLREITDMPESYKVLFLQGGASAQFALVPLNLAGDNDLTNYINTGSWSKKAISEAQRLCEVNVVASTEATGFTSVPGQDELQLDADAAYLHYTPNETIGGVEFPYIPDAGSVPLVADMSSNILSKPLDISRFGLIYAGAQKNIGSAGLTVVIVRESLLGMASSKTPSMANYDIIAKAQSMYNTPPTYAIYIAGLVFKWIKNQGGLKVIEALNIKKSGKLYQCIDESGFYSNPVAINCRSRMNVPFTLANPELDIVFLQQVEQEAGMIALKGHRSVGGMRASIYNAMPEESIDTLISFMQEFERTHG